MKKIKIEINSKLEKLSRMFTDKISETYQLSNMESLKASTIYYYQARHVYIFYRKFLNRSQSYIADGKYNKAKEELKELAEYLTERYNELIDKKQYGVLQITTALHAFEYYIYLLDVARNMLEELTNDS